MQKSDLPSFFYSRRSYRLLCKTFFCTRDTTYSLGSNFREFKKLRRSPQRKQHLKISLFVRFSVSTIIPWLSRYTKQGKCTFSFFGTNAFHVKAEDEKLIAADLRCRQSLKYENFTSSFGRLCQKLHQKSCRTCSTIIFPHSTNQIINLWGCRGRCRRHFLNSLSFVPPPPDCSTQHKGSLECQSVSLSVSLGEAMSSDYLLREGLQRHNKCVWCS